MVPSSYLTFFSASAGAAAALLGLLFVAISITPPDSTLSAPSAMRQLVAESAFTALVNAFFLSMSGTIPGLNLALPTYLLSVLAIAQTLWTGWESWPRQIGWQTLLRRLGLVALGLAVYGAQLLSAVRLATNPSDQNDFERLVITLFAIYAYAIVRSWGLIGGRDHLLRALSQPPAAPDVKPNEGEASAVAASNLEVVDRS